MVRLIRIILTLILIGLIYNESGIWTSLFAFLVGLRIELQEFKNNKNNGQRRGI